MNETILPATREDVPELVKMINRAYRGEAARKGWTHEADLIEGELRTDEDSLLHIINSPDSTLLKYIFDNTIAGCVFLQKQDDHIYLGMLTVDPSQQGSGIGKKLLRAAEAFALGNDCNSIIMTVISVRQELINWYQRHGYELTSERRPFPDDGRFGNPRQQLEFVVLQKKI